MLCMTNPRFRPLIRGFFFYISRHILIIRIFGFRPLIRGFFFYPVTMIRCQVWIFLISFGGATLSLGKEASLLRNMYISSRIHRYRHGLIFFSPILYRFQFLLINILSHRLLLYHLCPTILLLYGHREYKYAMNLAPHL